MEKISLMIHSEKEEAMCEREVTVYHHPCVVENYESVVGKWYATERRCCRCWLRDYDCYCRTIDDQAAVLRCMPLPNVDVVLYYFFSEVGRSGNTGHLLELLLPETTSSLVFGDVSREQELVDRMGCQRHLQDLSSSYSTCSKKHRKI